MPPTSATRRGACAYVATPSTIVVAAASAMKPAIRSAMRVRIGNIVALSIGGSLHSKREEHIAADAAAKIRVARRHEHHSACDDWSCGAHVPARRGDAIDRLELASG